MDRINIVQSGLTLSIKPSDLRIEFGNDSISVRAADNVVLFSGYDLPPETHGDYVGWAEWDGCSFATNDDRKLFEQTIQLAVERDLDKPTIGSIGVMLNDTRHNPRMFKLHSLGDMGRAYFEPLDDPGALVVNPLVEFWPLIDALP